MFWIALAVQTAAPPPPPHVQGLIAANDYPPGALDRNEQGSVYFQVVINPEGRVDTCSILLSSGYRDLDDTTCRIVTTRARFALARDDRGEAIYGTYRSVISWRITTNYSSRAALMSEMPPDLDLTINQAPEGVKLPVQFEVHYLVKANGTASHCEFSNDWTPRLLAVPPPVLVDLACQAAMKSVETVRNLRKEPVDARDGITVRFSVKP